MLLKLNSWVNCGFKIFLMPITRARGGARETLLLFPYNKFLNENSCKLFLLQPILLKQRVRREKKEQITKNVLQSVSGRNWPQAVCVCHYVEYHSMINDRCQSFWITRRIPQGLNALSLSRLGSGLYCFVLLKLLIIFPAKALEPGRCRGIPSLTQSRPFLKPPL